MSTTQDVEHYSDLKPLVDILAEKPEVLATGHLDTQDAALRATKFLFDLAISTETVAATHIATLNFEPAGSGPTTRSQAKVQKEQAETPRSFEPVSTVLDPTPISQLFVFGMNADQIWEQLELRTRNLTKVLDEVVRLEDPNSDELSIPTLTGDGEYDSEEDDDEYTEEDEDEDEDFIDDEMDADDLGEEGGSSLEEGKGVENEEDSESENETSQESSILNESIMKIRPGADEMEDETLELDLDRPRSQRSSEKKPRHPTLDDDFFSIDEFNRETEELESLHRSGGSLSEDDDNEEEEVDFFKPLDDATRTEIFEEADEENGGFSDFHANITYNDFFALPRTAKKRTAENTSFQTSKKAKTSRGVTFNEDVRVKTIEARKGGSARQSAILAKLSLLGASLELDEEDDEEEVDWDMEELGNDEYADVAFDEMSDEAEDIYDEAVSEEEEEKGGDEEDDDLTDQDQRGTETIQRLKNDLFEEEDDDDDRNGPAARLSAHERRMAELSTQIATLEAENVGEKDWQLMGEATSRSRPQNSLLEEDLEFEHNAAGGRGGAPEITEEKTKTLEDLIKGRILEGRYDDVVRKRPVDDKPFLSSKFFELSDQQSSRSLAQIYEDEYTAARGDGVALADDRDGKLAKEHQEIEKIWTEICYKLDALSNAHFTPKQPKGTIETISNISTLALESALPATMSSSSLLTPQEVHTPLRESKLSSRSELTPQEKQREHRKKLQARRKQRDKLVVSVANFGKKIPKNVKEAKSSALESLVKHGRGVTVVGKEGKPNGSKHQSNGANNVLNAKRLKL